MLATRHVIGPSLLAAFLGGLATNRVGADIEDDSAKKTVTIMFAVTEGTKLRKTFTRELELTHESTSQLELGFWQYSAQLGTWSDSQRIVIIDEYAALEEQVPEAITRSFERVEMEHAHDWRLDWGADLSGTIEREGTGEIMGSRVRFTRDRAEPEIPFGTHETSYVATLVAPLDPSEETTLRLAGLRANTDSTGLLPWRRVAIGDHWFVDVDSFHEICWPSGTLLFLDAEDERLVTPVDERLGQNLDGTFRVELTALEKMAGVSYARMSFHGILESRATFPYDWSLAPLSLPLEGPIALDLYASIRGHFRWNLDAGHLDSIYMGGHVTVEQDLGGVQLADEGLRQILPDITRKLVWTGTLRADVEFERM